MQYYSLSNRTSQEGQLQCALDVFPWTTATKIAQVCCPLLKLWHRGLRNSPIFSPRIARTLLFFLSQTLLVPPLLFRSPKHAFRLHPNLPSADYFSFTEKDLPFILEIITLQWRPGELCIWQLPAVRCMRGITFHYGKVIPETGLYSEL